VESARRATHRVRHHIARARRVPSAAAGALFTAFLSRFSVVRYAAKSRPEQFLDDPQPLESILAHGVGHSARADAVFLNSCVFADPVDVAPFMERCGVQTRQLIGREGVVSEVEERLNTLGAADLDRWVALNYELGKRPGLVAASAHVLHVGLVGAGEQLGAGDGE
jgi:hypothetical protein